jgi:hypothetical protein
MLKKSIAALVKRAQRSREIRGFDHIPDFILKDIGLSRDDLKRSVKSRSLGW